MSSIEIPTQPTDTRPYWLAEEYGDEFWSYVRIRKTGSEVVIDVEHPSLFEARAEALRACSLLNDEEEGVTKSDYRIARLEKKIHKLEKQSDNR